MAPNPIFLTPLSSVQTTSSITGSCRPWDTLQWIVNCVEFSDITRGYIGAVYQPESAKFAPKSSHRRSPWLDSSVVEFLLWELAQSCKVRNVRAASDLNHANPSIEVLGSIVSCSSRMEVPKPNISKPSSARKSMRFLFAFEHCEMWKRGMLFEVCGGMLADLAGTRTQISL